MKTLSLSHRAQAGGKFSAPLWVDPDIANLSSPAFAALEGGAQLKHDHCGSDARQAESICPGSLHSASPFQSVAEPNTSGAELRNVGRFQLTVTGRDD